MRNTLISILISIVIAIATMAAPAAAQYGGGGGFIIDPNEVLPGESVSFLGTGCEPGDQVVFTIPSLGLDLGSTTADNTAEGNFFLGNVVIPESTPPGVYDVHATCGDTNLVSSLTVLEPTGVSPGGGGGLAITGSNRTIPAARIGVLLVAAGGLALLVAGKRRDRTA